VTEAYDEPPVEHPFAHFVRILGRGRTGSRSLDRAEAARAFRMVLRGEVEPVQTGAFLMLLRVKEESPEELAGFVDACRETMVAPPAGLAADLDWSSYAGKKHQHPWYLLAMLVLAGAGYRVFVHGAGGHTPGRLYTEQAMRALGLPVADDWEAVGRHLDADRLAYLSLQRFCPALQELIALKPLLGLRSPVNTLTRMLNPLRARCSIQSIFHPAYARLHQGADRLLGQPRALVFKGDSGEVEIKPQADTRLELLLGSESRQLELSRGLSGRVDAVPCPATGPLLELWRDGCDDEYGRLAVLGTLAAALLLLDATPDLAAAAALALDLWRDRDRERLG